MTPLPRIPAPCKHCGQLLELRFNPTYWCDRGTDIQHECQKRC